MRETLIQFAVGSILFCVLIALDREHLGELIEACFPRSRTLHTWVKSTSKTAIGIVAAACLLDPLIPGNAHLTILLPVGSAIYPTGTLMDNLRLRVAPTGVVGTAGGDRTEHVAFDSTGSAEVTARMNFLETAVNVQLYDNTQPNQILKSATLYISPFVRQRILSKTFTF